MWFAEWVDEVAYKHFEHAVETNLEMPWQEHSRALNRVAHLRGYAIALGARKYSYYNRLADEKAYNECD